MKFLGISVPVLNQPVLDPDYIPLGQFFTAYSANATHPLDIALERSGNQVAVYSTKIYNTPAFWEADCYYVRRLMKPCYGYTGATSSILLGAMPWCPR